MASATPTVKLHSETIRALIEADAERAQSETLRCATAVAESFESEGWETCDVCGVCDHTVDSDPAPIGEREHEWLCDRCVQRRNDGFGVPSAWDHGFESGKADR